MIFDSPYHLWFMTVIPVFIGLSIQSYLKSNRWLFLFTRKKRTFEPYLIATVILCLTIVAFSISLAKPKIQYEKTYFNRADIEFVIGIDVSKSMLAEDTVFPVEGRKLFKVFNRLNRSRNFILNTLSELHGERLGMYIFASEGIEIVPFTRDYGYCNYVIRHINDANITVPGSDLGEAIKTGIAMLETSRNKGTKAVILISDGEDISFDKSSLYESARHAASMGIRIYTVGVGSGKGVLIPIRNVDGTAILNYYLDEDGTFLKTKLEQETLINISNITGGHYFQVNEKDAPENLIKVILKDSKVSGETKSVELAWFDLSPIFLLAALFLLVAEIVAGRYRQATKYTSF